MGDDIVGREDELAAIRIFVAAESSPHSLLLAGDPGMGKTTLWRAGVEHAEAEGHAVLATRPLQAEAKLAYGGLGDLLDAYHDTLDELPTPQAHALRAALLLEEPTTGSVDERAVSLGFLGVLRALARSQPVLVAVDDLQWLDRASARAVVFAARRLEEPVGLLLALRLEARAGLPFSPEQVYPGYDELEVRGLAPEEVHTLVRERLGVVLPRPVMRSVHATANGNPFFSLELARMAIQRGGGRLIDRAAMPSTLRELVGARIAALPADTRRALAATAALADPTLELVGAATGLDAGGVLGVAIEQEVVTVGAGRIRFAHPLLGAAAYGGIEPGDRRDLHVRLAALVSDPEERARHLALGAAGPDGEIAAALDEAASLAAARGAPVAAAELLEEALALTPVHDADPSRRRAVEAASYHFYAGDTRRARALLDDVVPRLPPGVERARALIVLARVRSLDDDIRAAVELLEDAVSESEAEPLVQAQAHEILSGILFRLRERFVESVEHARAAVAVGRALDVAELLGPGLGSLLLAEAALGLEQARATLAEADALGAAGRGSRAMGSSEFQVAVVRMWWEELDAAKASFEGMLDLARSIGDESSVPYIRVLLAQTECLRGRFLEAAAHADEGALRAEQAGQETLQAYALALRALAAAYAGEEQPAREAAGKALELAATTSGVPAEQFATAALGLLELSLERYGEAVEVLAPLVAFAREQEMREPGLTRFVPDLVEALVSVGRLDEAEDHLAWFAANAERLDRASARGAAARCRGLLAAARGDPGAALVDFESALAHHEGSPIPFDRARTLLALGVGRRRAKERRAARAALEEARSVFGSLGARIWEQRTAAELGRIGGRAPSSGELTPVERRVAELVAAGRTNKEVAVALFLSTRTVEGHLSRVYGKLGVHSRVELARKLA